MDPELRLVRALVRREPDVPVDPGEGADERAGVRDEVRAEGLELQARVMDEPEGGLLDGRLVAGLVLREPIAVVVLREILQEPEEVRGEVFGFHRPPFRRGTVVHRHLAFEERG